MKHSFYILTAIILLFSITGCFFHPEDTNFKEIPSTGTPPSVVIDLNFVSSYDTIYICKDETIHFSYHPHGSVINWAKFNINGLESPQYSPNDNGSIILSYYFQDFSPGAYPMTMTVFSHSGTGSIADKVGAEGYLHTENWTLIITDLPSMTPKITKTSFVNGTLKLEWSPFKGIGFNDCKLYKDIPYFANSKILVTTINDPQQTEFIDNTYHGEPSTYYLVINDTYFSSGVNVSGPIPTLSVADNNKGLFILKWDIPPYYSNLKGYRLTNFDDMTGEYHLIAEINNPKIDSCIIPNPAIGFNYQFFLTPVPLSDCYFDDFNLHTFLSAKLTAFYGDPSPQFYWYDYGSAPVIYMQNAGNIWEYNTITGAIDTTLFSDNNLFRYSVSENNHYLVSVIRDTNSLYFNDLVTPANNKYIQGITSHPISASVCNNGTGVVIADNKIILFDYIHEKILDQTALNNDFFVFNNISPSGKYFVLDSYAGLEFYTFNNNRIETMPCPSGNPLDILFADFLPGESEKMVVVTSSVVTLIDCNTWSIEKRWQLDNKIATVFNLSYPDHQLLLNTSSNLLLLNVDTGKVIKLSDILTTSKYSWWDLIYCNKQIFFKEGMKTKVSF